MSSYMLDTNAWLYSFLEPKRLPETEHSLLRDPNLTFGLSIISVWEVAKKSQIGKLDLQGAPERWMRKALADNIKLLELTPEIILDAVGLPAFPNRDPADELIVATANAHGMTLLTSDKMLKDYPHARIHYFKPLGK